jgi:hypothetical protein
MNSLFPRQHKGKFEREGITDGEGVAGGTEGAVDEGAERERAAERAEDLSEQDGDVVGVGVAAVESGVEGAGGAGAPLEVLLQLPPLRPPHGGVLGLVLRPGLAGGFARDGIVLAAVGSRRNGGERARAGRPEVEGDEAPRCRRHQEPRAREERINSVRRRVTVRRLITDGRFRSVRCLVRAFQLQQTRLVRIRSLWIHITGLLNLSRLQSLSPCYSR